MSAGRCVMEEMRKEQKLCDALLKVPGAEFPVHKLVLCNRSSYFSALFTLWSSPDCEAFDIPHASADIMNTILNYIYTREVLVTQENLKELFIAANHFGVSGISEICCRFMEEKMDPQTCITVWWLTNLYYYPELRSKAFYFLLKNFEEVLSSSDDFLRLSVEDLSSIIGKDQLIVRQESTVFEAVLRWIRHAPEERQKHLEELMLRVRLAQIRPEYFLKSVLGCELLWQNHKCKELLMTSMKVMLDARALSDAPPSPVGPSRPRHPGAVLVAIGGWSGEGPTNCIEAFDNHAHQWLSVPVGGETPLAYHGSAFLDGSVYLIGGFDGRSLFSTTHRLDLADFTWREVANMHSRRCYVSVALLDGQIYALGGFDGRSRLDTAERYVPEDNQWSLIAPMILTRSDASSTALNGKVYVCGGFNGEDCWSTAECYDPRSDQWSMIAEMSCRRSGLGVVAHGDDIYAVGGWNGASRERTVEAYNTKTKRWRPVASMMDARSNFGLEVLDGRLYVVGGHNGSATISAVEALDVRSGEWSHVRGLTVSRSALSCCVVSPLPTDMDDLATPPCPAPQDLAMEQSPSQ